MMSGFKMAYSLGIFLREKQIGNLSHDEATGQLKVTYTDFWQLSGFAISTGLTLDNQHTLTAAYNYFDNLLSEGEARKLLALDLRVTKNIFIHR